VAERRATERRARVEAEVIAKSRPERPVIFAIACRWAPGPAVLPTAGELAKIAAGVLGGRGGGTPTHGQGWGSDPSKVEAAFAAVREAVLGKLV